MATILVTSGLVISPFQARQLLASGAVLVNSKKVRRSSLILVPGDIISIDTSFAGLSLSGGKQVSFTQTRSQWHEDFIAFSQTKALSIVILR